MPEQLSLWPCYPHMLKTRLSGLVSPAVRPKGICNHDAFEISEALRPKPDAVNACGASDAEGMCGVMLHIQRWCIKCSHDAARV